MRPIQYFDPDYLKRCRNMTTDQVLEFLDEFRLLYGPALLVEQAQERQRQREAWSRYEAQDAAQAIRQTKE